MRRTVWLTAAVIGTASLAWGQAPGSPAAPPPAAPRSPDQPGNQTPGPGDVPAVIPPRSTDTVDPSDDAFLKETAGDLGLKDKQDPLDVRILNWFGLRPYLADRGLTVESSVTADFSKSLHGGGDTENDVFRHLFDFRLNYDTSKVLGLDGGTLSVDFQNQSGRNGSDLVGDAQGFDNADADGRTQVSELWYEQKLAGDKFRIKIGKVDANSEFAAPEYASEFLNSSFGYSPTITAMPTYPDPAVSLNVFVYPTPWLYAGYGIYDGGDGEPTGNHSPRTVYRGGGDFFQITEVGFRWAFDDQTLPGRLAGGVSYSNARFDRLDGGRQRGSASAYAVLEQKLFHYRHYIKDDARGVYAFAQFGQADDEVNDFRQHVSAGVTWVGPYQADALDTLGLAVTTVFFSNSASADFAGDSETSIEAYYNYQATSYLSIKPDLQYVFNPGGNAELSDALVATLRVTVAF